MRTFRRGVVRVLKLLPVLAGALAAAHAGAQTALVTLLDGEAVVTEGAHRMAAAPGVRLQPAALLETSATSAVLRVELADGSVLDLGPATRAMLQPPGFATRGGRAPLVYLLAGWAKVGAPDQGTAGGVVTAALEVLPFAGAAVVAVGKGGASVFAEAGPLDVLERSTARRSALPRGALLAGGAVEPRPAAAWLAGVPRAFRDPLPHRAAALAGRTVTAAPLAAPAYAQLADWLAAEPALRRDFPQRFEPLAQDPAFRRDLQQHLAAHPEWARVLNPTEPKKP